MVLQNYQKLIGITSNKIYVFALGVGSKCPRKINLNTLWVGVGGSMLIICYVSLIISLCFTDYEESYYDYDEDDSDFLGTGVMSISAMKPEGE